MKVRLIIDSNALCHAAYHSLGELKYDTQNTGVIFGFLLQLQSLATLFRTNDIVFCWDSRRSLRRDKYPWYKAKRNEQKTEIEKKAMLAAFKQFSLIRTHVLPTIGFNNNPINTGYESDDTIAQLVHNYQDKSNIVVSSDADLYQLLDYCKMYLFRKKQMYTKVDLKTEYGITPEQWVQVKQIAGCSSDLVPGVPGVGIVTAIKYLMNNINPGKKRSAILAQAGQDVIERNKWLVKLPLEGCPVPALQANNIRIDGVVSIFEEYGMESLLNGPSLSIWKNTLKAV